MSSSRKFILWLLIIVFLGVLIYTLIFISSERDETKEILFEEEILSGSNLWAKNIESFQDKFMRDIAILDEAILTRTELVSLIESLEDTGEGLGLSVSISSITSEDTTASTTEPQLVRMVINSEGPWSQSLTFVHLIQSLPYGIDIENLNLGLLSPGLWRSGATLRMTLFPEQI